MQSLVAMKCLKKCCLPTLYAWGKVKLWVRRVARTLLPSRQYKFFFHPIFLFLGTHDVQSIRPSSSARQNSLVITSISLISVPSILRFLTCISWKQMSFILKIFHCHIYLFIYLCLLSLNLNLAYSAVYFIWTWKQD